MAYEAINPKDGQRIKSYETISDKGLEARLEKAHSAFRRWRVTGFEKRRTVLERAASLLESRAEQYGQLMANEMGKPITQGQGEAKKCAWVCRYYAENGEELLKPVPHESDGSKAYLRYDPLGPVFAIMPWNFPFWQLFRHAAPGIMAGNVIVLKHSSNTPGCAEAIEDLILEAGAEPGVLQNLYVDRKQSARIIGDKRIAGVTITGSTPAGRKVAAASGENLKKHVMELGGSDPFVVLADADVDEAAQVGVKARCINSGQSCIAAKRFIVHRSIFDEYVEKFVEGMKGQFMGDPLKEETTIGPQARADLRDELADQVERSVKEGAKVLCGGEAPSGPGSYYPATVLVNVKPGTPAWEEEMFGPVATIVPFDTDEEAIDLANDTVFGLGAALWTQDLEKGERLAAGIDSGCVFLNGMVKSDPRLPFGGVKESGYGRELAREGIVEFMNAKTVWVK